MTHVTRHVLLQSENVFESGGITMVIVPSAVDRGRVLRSVYCTMHREEDVSGKIWGGGGEISVAIIFKGPTSIVLVRL